MSKVATENPSFNGLDGKIIYVFAWIKTRPFLMTLLVTSDHHPISRRMGQATGYKNGLKLETWSTFQWFQRFHKSRFYQVPQAGQKVSILNFVVWSEISPKTSCRSRSMVMRVQLQMASHSRCPRIKILSACGLADHQKREPSKKTTGYDHYKIGSQPRLQFKNKCL